jgi:molybdopterin-containing oxidoreductase family membrane subunit
LRPRARHRDNTSADPSVRAPLVLPGNDYASITDKVCRIVEAERPPKAWYIAFSIAASLTGVLGAVVLYLITTGVGVWGLNKPCPGASTSRTSSSGSGSDTRGR